jgi:hypothetical protein
MINQKDGLIKPNHPKKNDGLINPITPKKDGEIIKKKDDRSIQPKKKK